MGQPRARRGAASFVGIRVSRGNQLAHVSSSGVWLSLFLCAPGGLLFPWVGESRGCEGAPERAPCSGSVSRSRLTSAGPAAAARSS